MIERDVLRKAEGTRRDEPLILHLARLVFVFLFVVSFMSCATSPLIRPEELPSPESRVTLGPGDVIDVKFRFWPELDETQTIRPDGKISLQIVDDVLVAGLTPGELDRHLTKLYVSKIKDPMITVIVRSLADQRVYIGGEVRVPGLIPLQGKMTALEAIMASGGFDKRSAKLSKVIVVRHVDNKRYAALLDLKERLNNPEVAPFYLAPKDIVFVTRTKIDRVNQWVDQHIVKIIPDFGLNIRYEVDSKTTIGLGD